MCDCEKCRLAELMDQMANRVTVITGNHRLAVEKLRIKQQACEDVLRLLAPESPVFGRGVFSPTEGL